MIRSTQLVVTQELADRLKNNLIFDQKDTEGAVGAIQILIRNETPETVTELYSILEALTKNAPVGKDFTIPAFGGALEFAEPE